jgi:hypothetical protein
VPAERGVPVGGVVAAEVHRREAGGVAVPGQHPDGVEAVDGREVVVVLQLARLEPVQQLVGDAEPGHHPGGGAEVLPDVRGDAEPRAAGTQRRRHRLGEPPRVRDVLEHVDRQHHVELAAVVRRELLQGHPVVLVQ